MGKNNHEELLGGAPEATSNKQTVEDNLLGRPHVAEKSFAPEAKKACRTNRRRPSARCSWP